MRILSVHNYYQIRGGEDESTEAEQKLLREMGHSVEIYAENNDRLADINALQMATNTVWSRSAYRKVKQQLASSPHDLMHVQNFFPLISPSIYYAAKSQGIPVVQTLRNYRLLCPNGLFFRQGRVCEDCLNQIVPLPGVWHGCYRESKLASGAVATMLSVHRALQTWIEMVDVYVTLTEFARQKFIQGGLPANKIVVKPNFVNPDPGKGEGEGNYALYVGRLSVEKGLDTLLNAWEYLGKQLPLKIVGDGPLAEQVVAATKKSVGVEWLGRKPMQEVHHLMGEAKVIIFPSKWYETFGRVAIEAFAKGTPVIAANIGAIAELIEHGRTGFYFIPGDPQDLANQVELAIAHPQTLQQMRQEVRLEFESKYTAKSNYEQLMRIYQLACQR